MLYREAMAVCFQIRAERLNTHSVGRSF
jgi:hypothetical protein